MNELATKWDKKFALQSCETTKACEVLAQNQHLLPANGAALDYACGLGANALLLAEHQLETHAWDISRVALNKLNRYAKFHALAITTEFRDVENMPPPTLSFDVIVVSNFLHRPSFSSLLESVRSNGLLFYQTFIEEKINDAGPSNPDFLLKRNEMLELCASLDILVYREEGTQGDINLGWRNQAMVVARKK